MKGLVGLLAVWSIVLSGLALVTGVILIRKGHRVAHHRAMLAATFLALLFLVFYLTKWALYGTTAYGGPEAWRGGLLLPPHHPHPFGRHQRPSGPLRDLEGF